MSAYRESLHHQLEAEEHLLAIVQSNITQLEAFILQHKAADEVMHSLGLQLQSLKSLRQNYQEDCRQIRQEIAVTL